MSYALRRLISGPKARFVQDGVDLDLAYITDRLVIMAFPAAGLATLWRNDRRAVRKFLDSRHGEHWRVYNFCPRCENEYDGEEFYGRVSRYPFPDHHVPPLSMIPMVVADMTAWLAEDSRNVIVIHCKAGKGRSGTMACCYLISLPKLPPPPQDPKNISWKEKFKGTNGKGEQSGNGEAASAGKMTPDDSWVQLPSALTALAGSSIRTSLSHSTQASRDATKEATSPDAAGQEVLALQDKLEAVFDLHTSRRLKPKKHSTQIHHNAHAANRHSAMSAEQPERSLPTARSMPALSGYFDPVHPASQIAKPSLPSSPMSTSRVDTSTPAQGPSNHHGVVPPVIIATPASPLPESSSSPTRPAASRQVSRNPSTSNLSALGLSPLGRSSASLANAGGAATPGGQEAMESISAVDLGSRAAAGLQRRGSAPHRRRDPHASLPSLPLRHFSSFSSVDPSLNGSGMATPNGIASEEADEGEDEVGLSDEIAEKKRYGVSIASQRRWVGYWARILSHADARGSLDPQYSTAFSGQRRIKILRISVLQKIKKQEQQKEASSHKSRRRLGMFKQSAKSAAKIDSFRVSLGHYDDSLVEKLEHWERSARRRNQVFGYADPSARAPSLVIDDDTLSQIQPPRGPSSPGGALPSCVPGEAAWDAKHSSSRRPSAVDWEKCGELNGPGAAQRRLAQHGNESGVGQWGVNVLSEAERVRSFEWPDGHINDEDPDQGKKFEFLKWGWKGKDSNLESSSEEESKKEVWHHFEGSALKRILGLDVSGRMGVGARDDKGEAILDADREVCVKVTVSNKALNLLPDLIGAAGWVWFIPAFEEPEHRDAEDETTRTDPSTEASRNLPSPKGRRTSVFFHRDEIDFAKRITGLNGLQVEWEWV